MIKDKISIAEYRNLPDSEKTPKKANKYGVADKSDRTWSGFYRGRVQTIIFDSRVEMYRFIDLDLGQCVNITDLSLQERFLIGTDPVTYYVADFYYFDTIIQKWVVEEIKGFKTKVYEKKKKLFMKKYPNIIFRELLC